MSKYFAISLIPLLAVITVAQRRRFDWCLMWLVLPAAVLVFYEEYTREMYGMGLIAEAIRYGRAVQAASLLHGRERALVSIIYPGGCLVTVLCLAPVTWSKWEHLAAIVFSLAAAIAFLRLGQYGRLPFFADGGGIAWLGGSCEGSWYALGGCRDPWPLAIQDIGRRRDWESLFLGIWLAGTWYFAIAVNWSINARSILPTAPVLGILLMRRIDDRVQKRQPPTTGKVAPPVWTFRWMTALPLIAALVISLGVAWGDYVVAGVHRDIALEMLKQHKGSSARLWFLGHWGFQYYMEAGGAKPLDVTSDELAKGDWIVIPKDNASTENIDPIIKWLLAECDPLFGRSKKPGSFVATVSPGGPANFYALSALPFFVGPAWAEVYVVVSPPRPMPPPAHAADALKH